MNRPLRLIGLFGFIVVVVIALWTGRTRSVNQSNEKSLDETMHSAITNPIAFAKNRFTGGVGTVLATDRTTGLPRIQKVVAGSPAETAGLREGDYIVQVDGVATSGRKLVQNVESIRGFSAGSVTLTVQRTGSTNLQCVIHRTSLNSLGISQ